MPPPAAIALIGPDELRAIVREEIAAALGARTSSADLLDTYQAAAAAHRAEKTVREWCRAGSLKARKRGRNWVIRRDDLDRFMAGQPADDGFLNDALRRIR